MARKYGTNAEAVAAFFDPDAEGPIQNGTGSIYWTDKRRLYSYGSHYILAYRHRSGRYLHNGDIYSPTTSGHQREAQSHMDAERGDIVISFSALEAAGIDWDSDRLEIIDAELDQRHHNNHFNKTKAQAIKDSRELEASAPQGATVSRYSYTIEGEKLSLADSWHRPPALVLKYRTRPSLAQGETVNHYIMGMDEGSYFISKLPWPVASVREAYEAMKPEAIRQAEAAGAEIHRQGEWFFYQVASGPTAKRIYRQLDQKLDLTDASSRDGAAHIATRGGRLHAVAFSPGDKAEITKRLVEIEPGQILVAGSIRHRREIDDPWSDGPRYESDHRQLRLSYAKAPAIFAAHLNTTTGSWSPERRPGGGGGVD